MPVKTLSFLDLFRNQSGFIRPFGPRILMEPKKDDGGGGGGGTDDKDKIINDIKAENERLKQEMEKLKTPPKKDDKNAGDDDDLQTKAKKEKEESEKSSNNAKQIEGAIKFNIGVADFVKNNKDILPSEVETILKVAEKENYDTASAKASAVKVGIIQSFFAIQANLDTLTQAQKSQLEDFQKLTKNGKEDRAAHVYENIFEPAIEMLKKLKKAEEVGKARSGFSSGSSVENEYKDRLMKQALKSHLKEKV